MTCRHIFGELRIDYLPVVEKKKDTSKAPYNPSRALFPALPLKAFRTKNQPWTAEHVTEDPRPWTRDLPVKLTGTQPASLDERYIF